MLHAVHQKIAKNYASGTPAVLVVQLYSPLPLTRMPALIAALRASDEQMKNANVRKTG